MVQNDAIDFDAIMEEESKRQQVEQMNNASSGFTFDSDFSEIGWVAPKVSKDGKKQVGSSVFLLKSMLDVSMFQDDPTRFYLFKQSKITGDDDHDFFCNWSDDPNWILWRIYNEMTKGNWVDTDEINPKTGKPKKKKIYEYAGTKEFDRIECNGKDPILANGKSFPNPGWKPKDRLLLNVIDVSDLDYHFNTGKMKLLTDQVSYSMKDDGGYSVFPNTGISESCYKNFIYDVMLRAKENQRIADYTTYPIVLTALKGDPWWSATFGSYENVKMNVNLEMAEIVKKYEDLSDDKKRELDSLEKINVRKYWKTTPYSKIMKKLGKFVKAVDVLTGKSFYEELEDLVIKEKEERAKKQAEKKLEEMNNQEDSFEVKSQESFSDLPATPEVKEHSEAPSRPTRGSSTAPYWTTLDTNMYKGLASLTDDMRNNITGKDASGFLTFKPEAGQVYKCPDCSEVSPESFTHCPRCNKQF